MLTSSHLSGCTDCSSLDAILDKIDCVLTQYTKDQINNNQYELGKPIPKDIIEKLIKYKAIITKRRFNPNYAWNVPNIDIISRVNVLLS